MTPHQAERLIKAVEKLGDAVSWAGFLVCFGLMFCTCAAAH